VAPILLLLFLLLPFLAFMLLLLLLLLLRVLLRVLLLPLLLLLASPSTCCRLVPLVAGSCQSTWGQEVDGCCCCKHTGCVLRPAGVRWTVLWGRVDAGNKG
jgi:hypothetical protein